MIAKTTSIWVVVLAGGDGRRLGALTTDAAGICTPKQYCSLNGGPSLLQLSLKRALRHALCERIVVIVTEQHRRWFEPALSSLPRLNVVVQPHNRGTGLGVLLPLLLIERADPRARVIFLPSDHYVANEDVLAESVHQAAKSETTDADQLVLLGIPPDAPDPGFGYIVPHADSEAAMTSVHRFVEKPDREAARMLIRDGSLWNSGIFVGQARILLDRYQHHFPALLKRFRSVVNSWVDPRLPSAELVALYARHADVDFSREILQREPRHLQLLPVAPCGWCDVGTPERLATTLWELHSSNDRRETRTPESDVFSLATAFARVQTASSEQHAYEGLR
jgi:mannose-1-phosphate guanylyltransferase